MNTLGFLLYTDQKASRRLSHVSFIIVKANYGLIFYCFFHTFGFSVDMLS